MNNNNNSFRDKKGRFLPGHPYYQLQHGSKSGRKRSLKRQVEDALDEAEDAMPEIIRMLIAKAKAGDLKAAEMLMDRLWGKAIQGINARVIEETPVQVIEILKTYPSLPPMP